MFKSTRLYIKLRHDTVEITNLETGQTVTQQATLPFSSAGQVVGNFQHVEKAIAAVLRELGTTRSFWRSLKVLVQQQEGSEGGLSDIEKRALRDLGELTGARKVYLVEDERPLSVAEALSCFG
ncbi:MAG: hypothetical protein ABW019_11760 [Chitinophagaceae bacterium]